MKNTKNFYINGQWIEPSENNVLDVINPANEEVVSEISLGNENDLNKAVSAAKKVFPTYSITTKEERLEIFEKIVGDFEIIPLIFAIYSLAQLKYILHLYLHLLESLFPY